VCVLCVYAWMYTSCWQRRWGDCDCLCVCHMHLCVYVCMHIGALSMYIIAICNGGGRPVSRRGKHTQSSSPPTKTKHKHKRNATHLTDQNTQTQTKTNNQHRGTNAAHLTNQAQTKTQTQTQAQRYVQVLSRVRQAHAGQAGGRAVDAMSEARRAGVLYYEEVRTRSSFFDVCAVRSRLC